MEMSDSVLHFDPVRPDYVSLVAHRDWIDAEDSVECVCTRLRERPQDYLPVIRRGEVIGLLPASQLSGVLGAKFSFALIGRRPVSTLPLQPLTAVVGCCEIVPLLAAVFARGKSCFHHDVALLDAKGAYLGMIPIQAFAMLQSRLLSEQLREVSTSRDAALASARAKSRFLSTMSHELRTPLNAILGFADLLLETPLDVEQRDYVTTIRGSGHSLFNLVNDVLTLTSLEQGAPAGLPAAVRLDTMLRELLEHFSAEAKLKGLTLTLNVDAGARVAVETDAQRIRRAVSILIGNAIKFTNCGGVTLRLVSTCGGDTKIEVTDTGIGIAEEHLSRIFELFTQADEGNTRRHGGIGLGLPLCRALAESIGGRVEVFSRTGSGTTFQIVLRNMISSNRLAASVAA